MACLGVLFSLDEKIVKKLKSFKTDEKRLEYLQEDIEEVYFEQYPDKIAELDKAWDSIHRCLTDGKLEWENGDYPLNHIILGGELIYHEEDYIMSLKNPNQVQDIADNIDLVTEEILRIGYNKIDSQDYGFELTVEDFQYTVDWFRDSINFWKQAAKDKRYVLFTADH